MNRDRITGLRVAAWGLAALMATAVWVTPGVADAGTRARKLRTVLEFDSRLKDENDKPVSGIFPMTFALHKGKARRSFWRERHWVAVENGRYAVQLGRTKKLPSKFDPKTAQITIAIDGAGEVLREPLAGRDAVLSQVEVARPGKRIVPYAEKAGFAYESERAVLADRVGPYTGKDLKDAIEKLKRRKSKIKLSRNRINLTSAGGVGGTPYEQICPPGTLMVGIRGGAGIYIDHVQVVCAPME